MVPWTGREKDELCNVLVGSCSTRSTRSETAARRLRAGVAKFATQKISKNCARRTLVEICDGAVFILFLATHAFWLPLAAEDPQQRDAALVVGCKNMTILALHHQIALLLRCDCGHASAHSQSGSASFAE